MSALPSEFFTWEILGSLAGASAAVFILVQLTKELLPAVVPVRLYCWGLAYAILLLAAQFGGGGLTGNVAAINIINSGIVALTAMGLYELGTDVVPTVVRGRKEEE